MQIDIRPAENSDSAALLHILQVVFAEYPGCVLDIEEVPELLQPATAFAEMGDPFGWRSIRIKWSAVSALCPMGSLGAWS